MKVTLQQGDTASDFTLKNQMGGDVTLSSYAEIGRKVILSFHPLAWTSICEIQMRALEAKHEELERLETVALGISVDSHACKKAWCEYMEIEQTDLLADFWPHGQVARQYGLFDEKSGVSGRAHTIVDRHGRIVFHRVYDLLEIPDFEEVIRFIRQM